MVAGAASGAGGGALTSAYGYATGPGPHTVTGFVETTAEGTAAGAVLGGAGGAAGHGLVTAGGKLLSHVSPTPVEHVFWSGGDVPKNAAETFARSTGRTTLEMTPGGQALERVTADMKWADAEPLWSKASSDFAHGATGTAHVFQSANGVRVGSVWAKQEYPILRDNGVNIVYHTVGGG